MEPQKLRSPGILALALLAALCACGPSAADLPTYNTVPDFTLLDQTGEEFHSASKLSGHIWVADFIFTTCTGPCPRMSARMRRLEQELADLPEVRFVSFTVDPDNDTPAVLADYAQRYQAAPGRWFFLTGPKEELHELNRNAFLLGDVKGELDHSTRFVLVDAAGAVRGYYISAETEAIDRLQSHLRLLAGESS